MEEIIKECQFCGKSFSRQCFRKQHQKFCQKNPNRQNEIDKCFSKRVHVKNEKMYEKHLFTCQFCKKEFYTMGFAFTRHKKHCVDNPNRTDDPSSPKGRKISDEIKERWRRNGRMGGYRKGAGSGKKGYYKGLYCMSTWELAWVVYQLEHGNRVEQCRERFPYTMDERLHHYTPDFKIGETYYEIKGWHRPDTDYKINQFPKEKSLILVEGKQNEIYINYCKNKYGEQFHEVLYEKQS